MVLHPMFLHPTPMWRLHPLRLRATPPTTLRKSGGTRVGCGKGRDPDAQPLQGLRENSVVPPVRHHAHCFHPPTTPPYFSRTFPFTLTRGHVRLGIGRGDTKWQTAQRAST